MAMKTYHFHHGRGLEIKALAKFVMIRDVSRTNWLAIRWVKKGLIYTLAKLIIYKLAF